MFVKGYLRNKTGQAVVELMLLMALLVPVLIYTANTVRKGLSDNLKKFLVDDIRTQVRYGYSIDDLRNHPSGFNDGALSNIEGSMPITMSEGEAVPDKYQHPVQKVQEGWSP